MRPLALALLAFVACGDEDTTPPADTTTVDGDADADADTDADVDLDEADVRFIQATDAFGPIDVYVDGATTPVITNFPPFAGTPFQSIDTGQHTFAVALTGTSLSKTFASSDANLDAGTKVTVALFGSESLPVLTGVVEDIAGLGVGDVRYRLWNVVETIPEIDVVDEDTATPLATDLAYGASALVDVPAAPHDLLVDTNADATPDLKFAVPLVGKNVVVSLFFTLDAGVPILLGEPAGGGNPVKMPAEILTPPL